MGGNTLRKAGASMSLRTDRGGFLVLVIGGLGMVITIAGQLPLPTSSGTITLTGYPARAGGVGLLGLAVSFYGIFHNSESAYSYMFDRFVLVWGGRSLFILCWLVVAQELLKALD